VTQTPLCAARCKLNLSQRDVAGAVGLTQSGYSKIERGTTTPDLRLARRIAAVLGASIDELWPLGVETEVSP